MKCFLLPCFPQLKKKNTDPNNSTIFNRRIEASVLEVITSRKPQHVLLFHKHEAFQKVKYKLDLINHTSTKYVLANDNGKRALKTCGVTNLPSKAVLSFLLFVFLLLQFVSSFQFLIYKQLVCKEVFPVVA